MSDRVAVQSNVRIPALRRPLGRLKNVLVLTVARKMLLKKRVGKAAKSPVRGETRPTPKLPSIDDRRQFNHSEQVA